MWSVVAQLVGAFFTSLFNSVAGFFTARQTTVDEQTLGVETQAAADQAAATKTANATTAEEAAIAQAEADAPKTVSDDETRLGDGTA